MAGIGAGASLGRGATVVVVEPDIELSELLTNGIQEARADWTQAARGHVGAALTSALAARQARVRAFVTASDAGLAEEQRQLILLHRAVGTSILLHRFIGPDLPHKAGAFDWTLGPGARALDPEARYALFVYLRDSYASSGRKALMAGMMLLGVGVSLGQQIGFASLVDLQDGRVIWFNLLSAERGDLRNAQDATTAVRQLLDGVPL